MLEYIVIIYSYIFICDLKLCLSLKFLEFIKTYYVNYQAKKREIINILVSIICMLKQFHSHMTEYIQGIRKHLLQNKSGDSTYQEEKFLQKKQRSKFADSIKKIAQSHFKLNIKFRKQL